MEWKHDEQWNYAHAQAIVQGQEPWPSVGQQTSAALNNFPLGLWLLSAFSLVSHTPIGLMLWVPILNTIALLAFLLWALRAELPSATTRNLAMGLDVGRVSAFRYYFPERFGFRTSYSPSRFSFLSGMIGAGPRGEPSYGAWPAPPLARSTPAAFSSVSGFWPTFYGKNGPGPGGRYPGGFGFSAARWAVCRSCPGCISCLEATPAG